MGPHDIQPNTERGNALALTASVIVALCCLIGYFILVRSTGIFVQMFIGLGVELPRTTRLVIATYSWLFPLIFGGAAIVVIVKEFLLRDVHRRLALTLIIFVLTVSSAAFAAYAMYLPLFDLAQKLSQTK